MRETKDMLICDQCGEGISFLNWDEEEVADFRSEHEEHPDLPIKDALVSFLAHEDSVIAEEDAEPLVKQLLQYFPVLDAAPDLLESCKVLCEYIRDGVIDDRVFTAFKQAEEAIQKAEGR